MATQIENQIERKMIEVIDKFIIYMLSEQDKVKILYSQMIELEGEELSDLVNDKLKDYLTDGIGLIEEELGGCEFLKWFEQKSDIDICDIFNGSCGEIMKIQRELIEYNNDNDCEWFEDSGINITFNEDLLQYYSYMYIFEMGTIELKEYIINLLDPVEPK
jgi:hypothetical protein